MFHIVIMQRRLHPVSSSLESNIMKDVNVQYLCVVYACTAGQNAHERLVELSNLGKRSPSE